MTQDLQLGGAKANFILFLNTFAFTVCFACWMLNGVLVTFLASNQVFRWGPIEMSWLMAIPVLTGASFRLPFGAATDIIGGRYVHSFLLLFCSVPMYLLSQVDSFIGFAVCSFFFGMAGCSFSIGIAFTSVWYPKEWQGTAMGIFGAGNAGAAITTLIGPKLLAYLTNGGTDLEKWRTFPKIYSLALFLTGLALLLFTENRKPKDVSTIWVMLKTLKIMRVWRFSFYYFLVFGCFVAFSQWLMPYFVNVYYLDLTIAGFFCSLFSFPSGAIRALGGWLADVFGARRVLYWVFISSCILSFMVTIPKMEIFSPGKGIVSREPGIVKFVSPTLIKVGGKGDRELEYIIVKKTEETTNSLDEKFLLLPTKDFWQEPVVKVGQKVIKNELLAKGYTKIYFQANVYIFAFLITFLGIMWGIGKSAVYKHIPYYFPSQVGIVGGTVGALGGLGGFFGQVIFGYLLVWTGLWTSCWALMFLLSVACLFWMHKVVGQIMRGEIS